MNEYLEMLVKLAHENPNLREHLMPVLREHSNAHVASLDKTAFKEETAQFVAWCVMKNDKWDAHECQRLLDRVGVPMQEGEAKQTRGPLKVGEMVKVQASNCANAKNADLCHHLDGKVGKVSAVDDGALVIDFDIGVSGRFDGTEPGKKTGLGRWTPVSDQAAAKASVEIVYVSEKNEKPPSKLQIQLLEDYINKGLQAGESRSDIYHTGLGLKQAFNKEGQYYFSIFSQQRDIYPRSINPAKGTLLYVGLAGHRPGGWKAEFAQMMAKQNTNTP